MVADDRSNLITQMTDIPLDGRYYFITLTASEMGEVITKRFTHCGGFTDGKPRREIRIASTVSPGFAKTFTPCVFVRDEMELAIYFHIGGRGFIESKLAEELLPDLIGPKVCGQDDEFGFVSIEGLPTGALNHPHQKN